MSDFRKPNSAPEHKIAPTSGVLLRDVGRRCVGRNPQFLMDNGLMSVIGVVRLFDGTFGYRLSRLPRGFERSASPDEIEWVSDHEATTTMTFFPPNDAEPTVLVVPESRQQAALDCLARLGWKGHHVVQNKT